MQANKEKLKVALLLNRKMFTRTFAQETLEQLYNFASIVNTAPLPEAVDEAYILDNIPEAEAVITCWGTPKLTGKMLAAGNNLKLIAHGAGTPRAIIDERDWADHLRIFTAAPIIAIDVAETALWGMIDLLKHMKEFDAGMREGGWFGNLTELKDSTYRLNYRLTVGVVSASFVGRNMIRLLGPFGVKILLYDPYVTKEEAQALGATKAELMELIKACDVVSLHTPNLPVTKGLISEDMIRSLKDGSVFVNTARGPIVDQQALVRELKTGRIRAYLDVFDEEPLPLESELYKLPNVRLSPHMAGGHTINGGFERGDYIVRQMYTYYTENRLVDEVTKEKLPIMA